MGLRDDLRVACWTFHLESGESSQVSVSHMDIFVPKFYSFFFM